MSRSEYSRGNPIVGILIASACILVYLGALVLVIAKTSISMDQRRADASREFSLLAERASAEASHGFMDEDYVRFIGRALNESGVLEGVIISTPGHSYGFEREQGHALIWVEGVPQFRNRFNFSSDGLFNRLRVPGIPNANISGVMNVFGDDLAETLRQAIVMIAIALTVATVTLVVSERRKKPAGTGRAEAFVEDSGDGFEEFPIEEIPLRETAEPEYRQPRPETQGRTGKAERPQPRPQAQYRKGDYSERGQVVRREYTESRLAEELQRCAAAGADAAFIALEFKQADAPDFYPRLAADAARFFSSRDFVCERGERGLSIVCPELSLDLCFLNATEFHSRMMVKYPAVLKLKTDLCMGIAACSGREVNASRLIFEAEEALERALMDPVSQIIAFKIDPDKYRAFLEGRRGAGL